MWNGKRVSVVLMTYAERRSIRDVIERFYATGMVEEVLVVARPPQPPVEGHILAHCARR